MRKILSLLTLFLLLGIGGCGIFKPYVMDVQQGNIIDQQTVGQLQQGMTKDQVLHLFGTPILVNAFDNNYWTYAYTKQTNGGKIEKKHLNLQFVNDKLAKID